jgi:hypothetical protein
VLGRTKSEQQRTYCNKQINGLFYNEETKSETTQNSKERTLLAKKPKLEMQI